MYMFSCDIVLVRHLHVLFFVLLRDVRFASIQLYESTFISCSVVQDQNACPRVFQIRTLFRLPFWWRRLSICSFQGRVFILLNFRNENLVFSSQFDIQCVSLFNEIHYLLCFHIGTSNAKLEHGRTRELHLPSKYYRIEPDNSVSDFIMSGSQNT